MPLKLNGKPLQLHPDSPAILAIRRFLDKSSADDLYTKDELAAKCGVTESYMRDIGNRPTFSGYTLKVGCVRYWGNPKAIVELRKQVGQ